MRTFGGARCAALACRWNSIGDSGSKCRGIEDQTEQELSDRIYRAAHAGNTDDTKTLDGVLQDYEFERFVRGRVVDGLTDVAVDSISTGALSIGRVSVSASPTEEALFEVDGTTYLRTTSWRPNLSPGFLLYDHRLASHRATSDDAPIERIYIAQSDPETAVSEWAVCIERLIELGIPFRTKLLSRRVRYPDPTRSWFTHSSEGPRSWRQCSTSDGSGLRTSSRSRPRCSSLITDTELVRRRNL